MKKEIHIWDLNKMRLNIAVDIKEYFKDNTPKLQISPSNEIKTSFLYSLSEYKKNVFSKIFFSS